MLEDKLMTPKCITSLTKNHPFFGSFRFGKMGETLTGELPEDAPELSDVSGKGDVCVQDDDLVQVRRQGFGQRQLHQAVNT